MTTMVSELFDALRAAHIPEEKARAAAEAVAAMPEARLATIEGRIGIIEGRLGTIEHRLTRQAIGLAVLGAMLTGLYALGGWGLALLVHVAGKVGALG